MPGCRSACGYGCGGVCKQQNIAYWYKIMESKTINNHKRSPILLSSIFAALILLIILAALDLPRLTSTKAASDSTTAATASLTPLKIYLPIVYKKPTLNPFGVEPIFSLYPGSNSTGYTTGIHANYARLNGRISWFDLQPVEGEPINWALLAGFESELRTLQAANITPIIIVDDYPRWATDNTVRIDGLPTSCGPLLPERYADFARFMRELVTRYSTSEFNAHIWEMGNEPDVDPDTVAPDSDFGCWGDADDPFYNGRAYGQMLMTVTPVIRAVDPQAQVWIGGLLLDRPYSNDGNIGQPEDFFRGILEAGADPYFDMISYHAYLGYNSLRKDEDILDTTVWYGWGGMLRGKASYLRRIMDDYGVDYKPVFITETSQLCGWCEDYPDYLPGLFDMQANLVPRSFPRAMAAEISGFIWFPLEECFWQYSSLLDQWMIPKPAYNSYQTFNAMVGDATFIGFVAYAWGIEAYTFHKGAFRIDIIFAVEDISYTISVPQANYIAAYDRFGDLITPTLAGSDYSLNIQYEPIYLVRTR
jgi:hypothetical protein